MTARLIMVAAIWVFAGVSTGQEPHLIDPQGLDAAPELVAPPAAEVRAAAFDFLAARQVEPALVAQAEGVWPVETPIASADEMLSALMVVLALADRDVAELVERCHTSPLGAPLAATTPAWFDDQGLPQLVRDNARLYYARWLVQGLMFDEALGELEKLEPENVVDPASLLFYQAVVYHRLLHKDAGLAAIDRLINDTADAPARYTAVASLMREDLQALTDESLDHISRRMEEIRRRLAQGRAGKKELELERGVLDSLDKLIEDMEQQQQQSSSSASSGGAQQPSAPMPDSTPASASGPGQTDRAPIGRTAGWGDLPEKQREEALQQIGQEFPAHYREAIEQYFRRLATEAEAGPSGQ